MKKYILAIAISAIFLLPAFVISAEKTHVCPKCGHVVIVYDNFDVIVDGAVERAADKADEALKKELAAYVREMRELRQWLVERSNEAEKESAVTP